MQCSAVCRASVWRSRLGLLGRLRFGRLYVRFVLFRAQCGRSPYTEVLKGLDKQGLRERKSMVVTRQHIVQNKGNPDGKEGNRYG